MHMYVRVPTCDVANRVYEFRIGATLVIKIKVRRIDLDNRHGHDLRLICIYNERAQST